MSKSPNHQTRAKQLMELDGLRIARQLAGGEDAPGAGSLGFVLHHAIAREQRTSLSELCDTYARMPWAEFLEILGELGFEVVSRAETGESFPSEEILAAHPDKKLLLFAHSSDYVGMSLSRVLDHNVFMQGQVDFGEDEGKYSAARSSGGAMNAVGETGWRLDYYVTDGLRMKMAELEELGIEFTDWQVDDDDLAGRNPDFWNGLPQWVLDFTGHRKAA